MATQDADDYSPMERPRSPMTGGAILLGLYVVIYLAAAGVKYMLTAPEAIASAAASSASPETSQATPASVSEMPTDAMPVALPARMNNSRECAPGGATDIKCEYL